MSRSLFYGSLCLFSLQLSSTASVFLSFTKKNVSQRLLPSPLSIPLGAIDSTLSLSDV